METQNAQQKPLPQPGTLGQGEYGAALSEQAQGSALVAPQASRKPIPGGASDERAAGLLAEYDAQEGDREKQMAWAHGLSKEDRHSLAVAIGSRAFARDEERRRKARR